MSTLKTHNLQSPDAGSVNIVMTPNAGMVVTGITTVGNTSDSFTSLNITSSTSGISELRFTDNVINAGYVKYQHSDNVLILATNTLERLRIASDGVITGRGELRLTEGTSDVSQGDEIGSLMFLNPANDNKNAKIAALRTTGTSGADLAFYTRTHGDGTNSDGGIEKLRIESSGDIILKNNGGDNRIERDTTSGGPYLLFHNRGTGTTDSSGVYNMGGISAAGYRDVANPSVVGSIQFERQPTAGGASSGCDIVFRTGFNGTTSHTGVGEKMRLTYGGHLLPGANNQHDLGSTAKGWRNVYMNDLNLSNMNGDTNDVDGTQGSWTIQEGKDDLYIINRLNGKKFKIKMEEIS